MRTRLNSELEFRTLQAACEAARECEKRKILVCCGTGCVAGGSLKIFDKLKERMEELGLPCKVELALEPEGDVIGLKKSGCHGFCEMGPLVRIEPEGWLYTKCKVEDVDEIIDTTIINGEFIERLGYSKGGTLHKRQEDIPFYKLQTRRVLEHCGHIASESIEEYFSIGGYSALCKALFEMSAEEIINEVTESGLRGRGGAGFPTGRKWSQVAANAATPKYVVCNGDEGDPGAFMDRSCMEGDPHKIIEGMIIAGISTNSTEGYIYVRAEYPLAVKRLTIAIEQAKEYGLLGENILGSGKTFNLRINCGAGAFVCGEGSAMTSSIEGNRGMPRTKPPRSVDKGLFNKPTCLNNVETFANVPDIIKNGAAWFKSVGTEGSSGTKAFALTGNVVNTGLIEVPMGTTMREVVYDIGGGIKDGKAFKAVQIGGPSGGCLTEEHLDLPMDFDSLKKAGAIIGSGGLVVMDENTCMVSIARFFMEFICNESCGKCTPCREGTTRMLTILDRITKGQGKESDINELYSLAKTIQSSALCGLGKTAPNPVLSTLQNFKDEYMEHIVDKKCRTGSCHDLVNYVIDPAICKGCTKCARNCPVGAISGTVKQPHVIDQSKCIKCGNCIAGCPFKAIREDK